MYKSTAVFSLKSVEHFQESIFEFVCSLRYLNLSRGLLRAFVQTLHSTYPTQSLLSVSIAPFIIREFIKGVYVIQETMLPLLRYLKDWRVRIINEGPLTWKTRLLSHIVINVWIGKGLKLASLDKHRSIDYGRCILSEAIMHRLLNGREFYLWWKLINLLSWLLLSNTNRNLLL